MATDNQTKTSATSTALPDDHAVTSRPANGSTGSDSPSQPQQTNGGYKGGRKRSKYRHVEAYHSQLRHSSLSRDSNDSPSFLGFRNLMVIVLGWFSLYTTSRCKCLETEAHALGDFQLL